MKEFNLEKESKRSYDPRIMDDIISYLGNIKIKKILDIGAGVAKDSKHLQKTYNNEIWILEGDAKNNVNKNKGALKGKWNTTADNFSYYWTLAGLDSVHKRIGTTKYFLIDCDNITIPADVKFDLINSYLSCGFHYPISTYYNLIKDHSHPETKYIFDLRVGKGGKIITHPEFEILHIFHKTGKVCRALIQFNF